MQADLTAVVNGGLDRASMLLPRTGFLDLTGGVTQDAAFGRLDVGGRITDAITAFGFAQVQKDFHAPGVEFMAGGGLRATF